ncbi:uncharacterized protein LOC100274546 [Zea mays]|jgi:hypothetical protein|uniref:Uncharacterized protein n=1 Tax=Zea mays TaxID=4577 RepID=B4G1V2_MAIZE|nr:uncharacterized protein LOC100274546 [Zea mays]ACF88345.1 unknown [Zea mays]|eukprot:NP_001142374.1 uncharacterized protein LOC100274546 [Zea mays]
MAARPWLGSAQRRCSRACPCAPVFPAPRRRVLPAMEFAGSHPVVLVSDARSGHGRYRARCFPCSVLAWLPARQCALSTRLALIPIASSTSPVMVVPRRVVCAALYTSPSCIVVEPVEPRSSLLDLVEP